MTSESSSYGGMEPGMRHRPTDEPLRAVWDDLHLVVKDAQALERLRPYNGAMACVLDTLTLMYCRDDKWHELHHSPGI